MAYQPQNANGQATMANSSPVVLASDQASIPITVATIPSHAVTNAGTFAVQATPVTQADTFMLGGVNIKEINAVTPLMGNGVTGTGSQRVTIASDNTAFPVNATLQTSTNSIGKISDITTSVVPGTGATNLGKAADNVAGSTDTGVAGLFIRDDVLTTITPADGDYAPGRVDANGAQWVSLSTKLDSTNDSIDAVSKAKTSGGATPYFLISAASTNATNVKASAGQIYGIQVYNINAAVRYLKIYNKASAPTVGTDVPIKVIAIPGATTGAGSNISFGSQGIALGTGIAFALTTGITTADTTGVAASEILVNIDYA